MSTLLLEVLVNGVWQGALVAAAGALLSRLFVRHSARVRHSFWCAVLAAAVLLPVIGGSRIADRGSSTDQGSRIADQTQDRGSRLRDRGFLIRHLVLNPPPPIPDPLSTIHDPRSPILRPRSAILDP